MEKKNLLIVCVTIKDFKKISTLDLSNYNEVILASNNFEVIKRSEKTKKICKVTFLSKSISYLKVSGSVLDMIDKVNIYLDKVSKLGIFKKKELNWNYHVEGGYTTQRVQDILLAIESINLIFDKYMIAEILVIGDDDSLPIKIIRRLAFKKGLSLFLYNRRYALNQNSLKDFLRPIYFFLRSIICKITSKKYNIFIKSNVVLFQICGSSKKHIQNALFVQKELSQKGFTPINILWGNTAEVKKINNNGYKAVAIESYLKYGDIFISLIKMIKILIKVNSLKKIFYETVTFNYKGINITDMVNAIVLNYLYTDGPEKYRYRIASERLVEEYSKHLVAIKYCAAKFLDQGTILSEIIEDKYLKFDYNVGVHIPNPYVNSNSRKHYKFLNKNYLHFVQNDIEKKYIAEDMNVSKNNVIVFGAGRFNKHFDNLNTLTKLESKKELGIKKNYDIYMCLDYDGVMEGFKSIEEHYNISNVIIEFVENHSNIALMIKIHPSANCSLLRNIISKKTDNIYVISKKNLPDHTLNLADVIFCKYGAMGIEAMIYDVQVVSTILNSENIIKKENIIKVYGDAAEYIFSKENLRFFLKNKFRCKNSFVKWKNSFKDKRKEFIQKYYPKLEKSSEKILVSEIEKKINSHSNLIKKNKSHAILH